ncbi:MAG: shikimate dehydrogenase [Alphaproteobacteria bacterium CG11_big_fil_rev_8_21_14_0_20_39_49]|nr:MAG: shikimate dehydrogenase [Alphaproteobacteria bacterium CG11_big_fil_rev_8_21_14_0_20_39_49]
MTHKKAAVIGYPVKHSLSPVLHGYWLKKYNIDGEYGMLEVKPEDLEQTLLGLKDKGYVGCNLTIPHKEVGYKIIKEHGITSKLADRLGAVNTIYFNKDGILCADNTDGYGFIENIKQSQPCFDITKGKAFVLGAGGAASAVISSLIDAGVEDIVNLNRTKSKAHDLEFLLRPYIGKYKISTFDWDSRSAILGHINLLVNTTSLGMKGNPELDINLEKLPKNALVTDIVYSPIEVDSANPTYTKLLKNASVRGNLVVEGLGMLLYQAVAGFQMWFGVKPEVTEDLRKHVLSHIK